MVLVRIASLSVDSSTNQPVILLRPDEEEMPSRVVPIWIGQGEATAILLALQGIEPPRPMTHDLIANILEAVDVEVERVEITRLESGTFFAAIIIRGEGRVIAVDARPSDSIALAVRSRAPIFVAEEVLEAAAIAEPEVTTNEEVEVARFREFLDHIEPSDFQG
ncbi:MAG: bifunctional nuclease family protein [Actinomycetota bacterium]|jgi:bifunctional DNase/RNase|nr:bifunctional nuclease family protein [Actinomycetota bacterium]